jgi:hypothetical protein
MKPKVILRLSLILLPWVVLIWIIQGRLTYTAAAQNSAGGGHTKPKTADPLPIPNKIASQQSTNQTKKSLNGVFGVELPFSIAFHFCPAPPSSRIAVDATLLASVLGLSPDQVSRVEEAISTVTAYLRSQPKPFTEQVINAAIDALKSRYQEILSADNTLPALYLSIPREWSRQRIEFKVLGDE